MLDIKIKEILETDPYISDFFDSYKIDINKYMDMSLLEILNRLPEDYFESFGTYKSDILNDFKIYIETMRDFQSDGDDVVSVTILAGKDKKGNDETYQSIVLYRSEIVSIVGATGSGKSRLLADIEWMANGDTPTGRKILINGEEPDLSQRFKPQNKLVAQLSQTMNFVMDLSVKAFLQMHTESRMIENKEEIVNKILKCANELAGESFEPSTPITSLSGGQSRALMIADTAILSSSPIVLIDEIENAGIDRYKALSLLVDENKIVLMATHDPALALLADRRIVIKNGAIDKIIETSDKERELLIKLDDYDKVIREYRKQLRMGNRLVHNKNMNL